ncbi:MAG: Gfo/Idh/MocA family oxidoreductase [Verrucomicrobia bacterium]|nr:Gfo/Idh/MocA family oxidoreductase [Verrucomicrobiota bacterium]MCH8510208.1 Gfo/Idh/MocA family oxidoreductase [Kiritimatiellia bacterium]
MNTGIIGVSGFGARHYDDLLREVERGNATASAACIINPEEVPEKVAKLQSLGCRIYGDVKSFFAEEKGRLDLVMIPTGIATHRPFTEMALAAGAHVFVEKPAAATVADVAAMMAAEANADRRVFVGFQHRYDPLTRELQQRLLSGELGRIREVRGRGGWPRPIAYYQRNAWAGRLRQGTEPVNDAPFHNAFAHDLLTALWFASPEAGRPAEPLQVEAELYRANDIESCDTAFLHLQTDGVPVHFAFSHVSETQMEPMIRVVGEKGELTWTHDGAWLQGREGQTHHNCLRHEALRPVIFQNIRDVLRKNPEAGPVCSLSMARALTRAATLALAHPIHQVDPLHVRRLPTADRGDRWVWDGLDARLAGFIDETRAG